MRRFIIAVAAGMVMTLTAGTAIASDYERREGREYEHSERYGSKMYGTVQSLPEGLIGTWQVNGKEVEVTKETAIKQKHGKAEVGAYVEVEGNYSGKTLVAHEIEVKRARK